MDARVEFSFFAFVSDALRERDGDVEKTTVFLLHKLRVDSVLRRQIVDESIQKTLRTHIAQAGHLERAAILKAASHRDVRAQSLHFTQGTLSPVVSPPEAGAQNHAENQNGVLPALREENSKENVLALAKGVEQTMSHFRLPKTRKFLKDANREDVKVAAAYYEGFARASRHKVRWLNTIASRLEDNKLVGQQFDDDALAKIWKET